MENVETKMLHPVARMKHKIFWWDELLLYSSFIILHWLLMLLALLRNQANRRDFFRQFPAHLVLDDFRQGDVREAHAGRHVHERTTPAAATGVQLAHTARHNVDEHVRCPHFFQGLFAKFSVHLIKSKIERVRIPVRRFKAILKIPINVSVPK